MDTTWRHLLKEYLAYDRWANLVWLPYLAHANDHERKVFKHILGATLIWLERFDGVSLDKAPDIDITEESIERHAARFLSSIDAHDFHEAIHYKNLAGEAYEREFGDLARHVLMHSMYHRGQLRESFGQRGADFPETDFFRYTFERDEQ